MGNVKFCLLLSEWPSPHQRSKDSQRWSVILGRYLHGGWSHQVSFIWILINLQREEKIGSLAANSYWQNEWIYFISCTRCPPINLTPGMSLLDHIPFIHFCLICLMKANRRQPHCSRGSEDHRGSWENGYAWGHRCAHPIPNAGPRHGGSRWLLPGH